MGETLIFNGRARAPPPPVEEGAPPPPTSVFGRGRGGSRAAPTLECRWLDSVATEPGAPAAPAQSLATVRGYLLGVSLTELTARNVSTLYHTADPQPAVVVHSEPITPPGAVASGAVGLVVAGGSPPVARPRVMLASGNVLLVESGGEGGGTSLRLYSSQLPYDPPTPPTWPTYLMGAAVIGITACWQLYKRRGKSDRADRRGSGRNGRGRSGLGNGRGGNGNGRGMGGYDDDDFGDRSRMRGAEAHYAAHMNSYGRGPGGGGGYGGKGGGFGGSGGRGGGGGYGDYGGDADYSD